MSKIPIFNEDKISVILSHDKLFAVLIHTVIYQGTFIAMISIR